MEDIRGFIEASERGFKTDGKSQEIHPALDCFLQFEPLLQAEEQSDGNGCGDLNSRLRRLVWRIRQPMAPAPPFEPTDAAQTAYSNSFLKYAIVLSRPVSSGTVGSQPRIVLASVMFGCR